MVTEYKLRYYVYYDVRDVSMYRENILPNNRIHAMRKKIRWRRTAPRFLSKFRIETHSFGVVII